MKETIGFIGLGAMGSPMAQNLLKNGYPLIVYDLDKERMSILAEAGAAAASSCSAVARQSEFIITMLPSSPHVRKAILGREGVLEGIQPGSTVIDMSTIDPDTTRELEELLSERNVGMLDAPVARGVPAAMAGTLSIFVGGNLGLFEKCKPILESMGEDIEYVGPIGAGEVVKLVNNLILSINVCVLAEGMVLGIKAGVKPDVLFNALGKGSANSFALQNHFKKFVMKGKFEEGVFPVEYIIKDLDLALKTAENLHVPQFFGSMALQVYHSAVAEGLGGRYYPVVVKMLERLVNVEVRTEEE